MVWSQGHTSVAGVCARTSFEGGKSFADMKLRQNHRLMLALAV
jgi:hypothetical protein